MATVQPPRVEDGSSIVPARADRSRPGRGPHLGPFRITPFRTAVTIAFVGSLVYLAFAVLRVRDVSQIPMLSSGFGVLGIACAAIALGGAIEMWRAASRGRSGRAFALAIWGGIFGLAAVLCFAAAVVFALLWSSG